MTYVDALRYLGGLGRFGMRLGLESTLRLLSRLGDPQLAFPAIHVGGTNGKGSTAHAIASVLRVAGLRVGLYTSPHLLRFTERIQIAGREIERADVARLVPRVREAARGIPVTFFEVATALGFLHFAEARVEVAVVEVGLGGRLDATNVLRPLLAVVTNVGLEHREHLGPTLADIAREKAGIIKGGLPVVAGVLAPEALSVVEEAARERAAPLHRMGRDLAATPLGRAAAGGERFHYRGRALSAELTTPLAGKHQVENAALAAYAAELAAEAGLPVEPQHVSQGLALVHLPGRFAWVAGEPPLVLDAAHNPVACEALAATLGERLTDRPVTLVFGVLSDKDHLEMLRALAPRTALVIAVRPDSPRARDPHDVVLAAKSLGLRAEVADSLERAISQTRAAAGRGGAVTVTGSFYTVAAAMKALGQGGETDPIALGDAVRPLT